MGLIDQFLTVNETQELLSLNGIGFSKTWIRILGWRGTLKSQKIYNSVVFDRDDILRLIHDRKAGI